MTEDKGKKVKPRKPSSNDSNKPNDDARENEIWTNFYDSIKAEASKGTYTRSIKAYMKFDTVTKYSQLIDRDKEVIETSIKNYLLSLQKRNLSTSSIKRIRSTIKHFYEMNYVDNIGWKRLSKFIGEETVPFEDRAYTHEEIGKLLKVADFRLRVCILLECSAGLRVGALPTITFGHLHKKEDCYKIDVYKGRKGNGKYFTFCNPETAVAIDEYRNFREMHGEVINDNSPLLRADFNTEEPDKSKVVKGIKRNTIINDMLHHAVLAGLRTVNHENKHNRKEVKINHGLRKFFRTQLALARIDFDFRKVLVGHSPKDLDRVYTKFTEDELFSEYKKAIPFLTIDETIKLTKKVAEQQQDLEKIDLIELDYKQKIKMLMDENKQDKKIMEDRLERMEKDLQASSNVAKMLTVLRMNENGKSTKDQMKPFEDYTKFLESLMQSNLQQVKGKKKTDK